MNPSRRSHFAFYLFAVTILLLASCTHLPAPLRPPRCSQPIQEDLEWLASLKGTDASRLHRMVFGDGPLDGRLYLRFIRSRVDQIEGPGPTPQNCAGLFACLSAAKTISVSRDYLKPNIPRIARLSYLIHEARHAEDWGWPHEKCPELPVKTPYGNQSLDNTLSCDRAARGAYGIQYVMLKNIERFCKTCDDATRIEAGKLSSQLLPLILDPKEQNQLITDSLF